MQKTFGEFLKEKRLTLDLSLREFRLFELERIAATALAKGPECIRGRRVNVERLAQETFGLKIIAFHELSRRWKTYAFSALTPNRSQAQGLSWTHQAVPYHRMK